MLDIIFETSKKSGKSIIVFGIISGMSSVAMLAVLNDATTNVQQGEVNYQSFILFLIALVLSSFSRKISLNHADVIVEDVVMTIRNRITDKIRKSSLLSFEKIGKETYYVSLTQHTRYISDSYLMVMNAFQSSIILVGCVIYIGFLSIPSLIISIAIIFSGVVFYLKKTREASRSLVVASDREKDFFALFEHILKGFKELALSRRKSRGIFNEFNRVSDESERLKISVSGKLIEITMMSQANMYFLIAMLLIVLPFLQITSYETIPELIVAILFLWGPLETIVGAIPHYARAKMAAVELDKLEKELDKRRDFLEPAKKTSRRDKGKFLTDFGLQKYKYIHSDINGEPLFTFGELGFRVSKGEIVFITGGNGSGKTTLFKSLTSLYSADSGDIILNDIPLVQKDYRQYRENFSAIFSDFHLFEKLYGIKGLKKAKVDELLKRLGIYEKTSFKARKFSNLQLSLGQRKRLGIVVALLEERPILLLDEPAAELDPEFRRYFYETLLPQFRDEGRTIVVITHDDRYFSCCDRLIKMESGLILDEEGE